METNGTNETPGLNENQDWQNKPIATIQQKDNAKEIDAFNNVLSGVAAGNLQEEKQTTIEESAIKKDNEHGEDTEQRDKRGFMGDFAEPQHDDG